MKINGIDIKLIVSPEEMTTRGNYAIYKYVMFEDGETLFCQVKAHHRDVMEVYKKRPISAGKILVDLWRDYPRWNHLEVGSFTLGLRGDWEQDRKELDKKLEGFTFDPELYG